MIRALGLILCMRGNFLCCRRHVIFMLLSSNDFIQKIFFQTVLSGTLSKFQTVWIQIRTDVLSVLVWVKAVNSFRRHMYHQTTKVAAGKERINVFELVIK